MRKCVICKSNLLKELAISPAYRLLQCRSCGTVLKDPPVGDSDIAASSGEAPMEKLADEYAALYRSYREQTYHKVFTRLRMRQTEGAQCLDVGCATGWFLSVAASHGLGCYGVDLSAKAINQAKTLVPTGRFQVGTLSPHLFEAASFDLATAFDVLEHLADPVGFLELIWRRMKSDGHLVIRVPVTDSLMFKSAYFTYHITDGKYRKPLDLLYRYHVIGFSTSSLMYVLSYSGFQVVDIWRENSIDPRWISHKHWASSLRERVMARALLFAQSATGLADEVVVIARRLSARSNP